MDEPLKARLTAKDTNNEPEEKENRKTPHSEHFPPNEVPMDKLNKVVKHT